MFGKTKDNAADINHDSSPAPEMNRSAAGHSATQETTSSTVQIGDGAQVEGDIVAQELTIGGRVKGTIRANRVKLNSTAVVEGDIYHRSLAIEENAQFEGMSRRQENVIDTPSLVPTKRAPAQVISVNGQGNGASDAINLS